MMTSTSATEPTDAILRVTRAYIEELLPDSLEGRIEPGRVLECTVDLGGYRAMADREARKVMIRP